MTEDEILDHFDWMPADPVRRREEQTLGWADQIALGHDPERAALVLLAAGTGRDLADRCMYVEAAYRRLICERSAARFTAALAARAGQRGEYR